MFATADSTAPLGFICLSGGVLNLLETRRAVVVTAVGNLKLSILDELHADGALPLLVEALGHILELFLDVLGDSLFVDNSGESVVLSKVSLTSLILSVVVLRPSELTPLVRPVKFLESRLKCERHRVVWVVLL